HLNSFFDLSIHGPGYRKIRIMVLGAGFIALASIVHIIFLFYPILAPARAFNLSSLAVFLFITVVRLAIILWIPALLALNMAGNYLTDIFELKDLNVAWNFIGDLSLGGSREVIHIRDSKVIESDQNSAIALIGGPGRVLVEFDTAVLFEKPDGTPHVIGPVRTIQDNGKDNTILEGFERLREPIVNLRDQYIGSPSGEPMTVESRSQDGIKVSATDGRGLFSVRRDGQGDLPIPTTQVPYPFHGDSIETLIYQQAVTALPDGLYPSGQPPYWTNTMQGLVRGSLSDFMSQNDLSEYLAGIGALETELSEFREDTILWQTLQYSTEMPDSTSEDISKPKFHPRTELSDRFMRYTDGFIKRAHERGMDLHWIGVGTWIIPDEIASASIDEQHVEAWRINRENALRSDPKSLEAVEDEAYLKEKIRLMQNVPLVAHRQNQARYADKRKLIEALLLAYWEQLGEALETYYKKGARPDELAEIENGVLKIEKLLHIPGGHHFLGDSSISKVRRRRSSMMADDAPPAPGSSAEAADYRSLLMKLDGNYRAAEGMIANEERRYPSLTREQLIERIIDRLERYGH
ncbi:MAG: hypothetical protein ACXWNC_07500, partial [Anaerolineales bacterium]